MVPGTGDYVDLSKTILVVRVILTKANGEDLDADENVGIVNNFLHTLFKQVGVFLKEQQVRQASGTYAYQAYLETLLNYVPAAKKSQLTSAMFYKDQAGKMDVADPTISVAANANTGVKARYVFSKTSGTIEMTGPSFCDIFMSERMSDIKFCQSECGPESQQSRILSDGVRSRCRLPSEINRCLSKSTKSQNRFKHFGGP